MKLALTLAVFVGLVSLQGCAIYGEALMASQRPENRIKQDIRDIERSQRRIERHIRKH